MDLNTYVILDDWNNDLDTATRIVGDPVEHIYLVDIGNQGISQIFPVESQSKLPSTSNKDAKEGSYCGLIEVPPATQDEVEETSIICEVEAGEGEQETTEVSGTERKKAGGKSFGARIQKEEGSIYGCESCNYQGRTLSNLRKHIRYKHSGQAISCDQCDYKAKQNGDMKRHQQAKHSNEIFCCDLCDYVSHQPSGLNMHKRLKHANSQSHSCDECDFSSVYSSALERHKRSHSTRLHCSLCKYTSNRKDNLKLHFESRHENKRISCPSEDCDFTGASRSSVNNHVKATHDLIRYQCEICTFQTARKTNLDDHVKAKHLEIRNSSKKKLSAYLIFFKEQYAVLVKEKPWLTKAEKRKLIREMFEELPREERMQIQARAKITELKHLSTKDQGNDDDIPGQDDPLLGEDKEQSIILTVDDTIHIVDNMEEGEEEPSTYILNESNQIIQAGSPNYTIDPAAEGVNCVYVKTADGYVNVSETTRDKIENSFVPPPLEYHAKQIPTQTTTVIIQNNKVDKAKIYSCDMCDYRAKHAHHIKSHKISKHNPDWLHCELCPYKAKRKDMMKRHHLAEHEKLRYKCDHCDHLTSDWTSLKKHMECMHEGKMQPCPHCGMLFKHKSSRLRHINAEHKSNRSVDRGRLESPENSQPNLSNKLIDQHSAKLSLQKKKKKLPPAGHKRPKTKYLLFCAEERPKIVKENPDWSVTEIGKELGRRWNELDSDSKQVYEIKYEDLMKDYKGKTAVTKVNEQNQAGKKPPQGPFFLYMKSERLNVRKENPGIDIRKEVTLVANRWAKLTETEKEHYRSEYRLAYRKYKLDLFNKQRKEIGAAELEIGEVFSKLEPGLSPAYEISSSLQQGDEMPMQEIFQVPTQDLSGTEIEIQEQVVSDLQLDNFSFVQTETVIGQHKLQ